MSFAKSNSEQSFPVLTPPRLIITGTQNGSNIHDVYTAINSISIPTYSTGTMVASEYKKILEVKGKGIINFAAFGSIDGPRTIGLRITVDGVQVYVGITSSGSDRGLVAIGALSWKSTNYLSAGFDAVPFNGFFLVEAISSDTVGGPVAIAYKVN